MSLQTATGVVSSVTAKPWTDRNGNAINLYSFQLQGDRRYFRTGTNPPGVMEGQTISFTFEAPKNTVDLATVQQADPSQVAVAPKPPSAPQAPAPTQSAPRRTSSKENWDARAKYWDEKEKRDREVVEPRITYSAAQRDAVSLVSAALNADALSFGNTAKGARLDMILDFVDQVTQKFVAERKNLDPSTFLPASQVAQGEQAYEENDYAG